MAVEIRYCLLFSRPKRWRNLVSPSAANTAQGERNQTRLMQAMRGMIISDDKALVADLDELLTQVTSTLYVRKLPFPEDEARLSATVKSYSPAIVFLDMSDAYRALQVASVIQRRAPGVHLVGFAGDATRERLLAAVRSGMRDVLTHPFSLNDVHRCINHASSFVDVSDSPLRHRQQILTFLPAKPGSGTSTVALHTACAMARFGAARVALMDLDFDCGIVDFMLKLPFDYGLSQIAEFGSRLDEAIWSRVVAKYGDLDVLRAGSSQVQRKVTVRELEQILGYARGNYDAICIDLPGASHELHLSVLEQSDSIFIVCTPDLPSVHLVRRRMAMLKDMKMAAAAKIIYNRARSESPLSKSDVEDVLGCEVFAIIDNDFLALQKAMINGRPVDMETPLGRMYQQLVNKIISGDEEKTLAPPQIESRLLTSLKRLIQPARRIFGRPYKQAAIGLPDPAMLTAAMRSEQAGNPREIIVTASMSS